GVERRLLELRLKAAVAQVLVREDRGQDFGLLVAGELAADVARDTHLDLRRSLARALSLLLHQRMEAVLVDRQAAFAGQLLRQLEREAVRVVEPEGLLAVDRAVLRRLLEQRQPARERLAEALLLFRQHALDLLTRGG